MQEKLKAFQRLLDIMDDLREKCPWDRKQTLESLSSLTIEETYELVETIQDKDMAGLKEEIGDLLLHMVFYSKIASEQQAFDIGDALNAVCDKLVRRHPHIYGDVVAEDADTVKQNWEKIKMSEGGKKSVLQGVPKALPALLKAQRMQEKAAQVGFDWDNHDDVWAKVEEEMNEYKEAEAALNKEEATKEFGDLLFSLVNHARFRGIDATAALDLTNRKFRHRVEYIEQNSDKPMDQMTLAEMDALWEQAKG